MKSKTGWQYYHTVWMIILLGWLANYMVRLALSPALLPIMKEFHISYAQAGMLMTAFFYAYVAMQLPAGYLGDRFGRKKILIIGTLVWALSSLFTGFVSSFTMLFILRFITGLGEGTYYGNDRPIIASYTPKEKAALGLGLSFGGLGLGMALGVFLGGVIAAILSWRAVFILFSLPSFLAAYLIHRYIKDVKSPGVTISSIPFAETFKIAFHNRDMWYIYFSGIALVYALWFMGTWGPAMFREIGVEGLGKSSLYSSLYGLAALPGLITSGLISDWMKVRNWGRKGLSAIMSLILAALLFLIGYTLETKGSPILLTVLIFLSGYFMWGTASPMFALLPEIIPAPVLGTMFGLTNMIQYTGSLIAPGITGWIKDVTGSFAWGAYAAAIFSVIGAILILMVRPAFQFKPEIAYNLERVQSFVNTD